MSGMTDDGLSKAQRSALEKRIEYTFDDASLLEQALTHSSVATAPGERLDSNERLEFLGDRVLGLVIAELLVNSFPTEQEGALARRHSALVSRDALHRVAEAIGLSELIVMARGEEESGGRDNASLVADSCEAVIAAIYLDGGLEAASRFISAKWLPLMEAFSSPPKDNKTALQEWAQGRGIPLPEYAEVDRDGPPHAPVFTVSVTVSGYEPVTGTGGSKRIAEQEAAGLCLDAIRSKDDA
ncbi:MAG: ribonuclease III [Rhodospirillales bacterium]|nr:ribonuclease III [Rhodospirillales bacterium]MCW8862454.1 ribonuclease III [Rhodospirillales bacterium]MCW8952521.1 ribonuclease III [Rhodospirillales bacterium]MCW8970148.1 ribonuclease III [Rhodospirillales bacterium]MCW9003001.1 ribonuclease III [Rhodospirillales bacterium]